jgi:crossover junction endodeoxyribonuclease RuvC
MRVLGLDPGTATTGYGIIDGDGDALTLVTYGVIATPARTAMAVRLQQIYEELSALIEAYQPDAAGIEKLFFGRNVTTAITVGQARGVLLLALAHAGLPIGEYEPARIKESITGYGNADKAQMQLMVRHLLDLDETPRPDDAADGLAVAITHYNYQRFESLYS